MNASRSKDLLRGARTRRASLTIAAAASVPLLATLSAPAHAYVGPGAGLGVIGTLFGIVAALVLALFGLFWYPLKRAFGKRAAAGGAPASELPTDTASNAAPTPAPTVAPNASGDGAVPADAVRREASAEPSASAEGREDAR